MHSCVTFGTNLPKVDDGEYQGYTTRQAIGASVGNY